MTASVLVFVPVVLLCLVAGFCFVGCVLDRHGTGIGPGPMPTPFTTYSDSDVIGNPDCVAYWPLDQAELDPASGDSMAPDVVGKNTGTYKSVDINNNKYQALFPCPAFTLDPSGPVDSAFAPGTLTIGAPGIVQGDTVPPHDPQNPVPTKAMQVNGGFVEVPFTQFSNVINRAPPFTVEAWVRREWDNAAPPAFRAVIDSRNQGGGLFFGYAIWVNEAGNWQAQLGATGNGNFIEVTAGAAVQSAKTHIVLTVDQNDGATLFINGTPASPTVAWPPGESSFAPNTVASLVIGVGTPYLPPRTQPSDNNFFPLMPFNGTIQDVAIYKVVLDAVTIQNHSDNGNGNPNLSDS